MPRAMRRIMIVGCSGAGKSTLARELCRRLGAEHVELDSIFHQPGWTPLPIDEYRTRLDERLAVDSWITDGNYDSSVQDMILPLADTVLWLDLPRSRVMKQVILRTLRRVFRRAELWNGNRERWSNLFDPRPEENIILWSFTRHAKYREKYTRKSADPAHAHIDWRRFCTGREIAEFLAAVPERSA
jgi:adenylate kinase family enzyme